MAEKLTIEKANEVFSYDVITGILRWSIDRPQRVKAGDIAGTSRKDGYLCVTFNQEQYLVHRIIWLMIFGDMPKIDIDHINRNKKDNRLSNLRLATRSENCQNVGIKKLNKSGFTGVSWHSQSGKWEANIRVHGVSKNLGRFLEMDKAVLARMKAEKKLCSHSPLNLGVA